MKGLKQWTVLKSPCKNHTLHVWSWGLLDDESKYGDLSIRVFDPSAGTTASIDIDKNEAKNLRNILNEYLESTKE